MLGIVDWIAGGLFVASLPYWIPAAVIALRMRIFTRVNGEEGLGIPGEVVDASLFKQVYSHPAADGRSRGAALSDLFWYWLSPGPEMHQEHLEPGEKYEEIVGNANDVVTALKCCGLRHMAKRRRLTRFLVDKLQTSSVPHILPARLS